MNQHDEASGERLIAYLAGELPEAARQALGNHLALCPSCRRELAWHRWSLAALARWPAIEPSPTAEMQLVVAAERLLARRRQERAAMAAARRWHAQHWWVPALVLPLGLAALLAVGMVLTMALLGPLLDDLGPLAMATLGAPPLIVSIGLAGALVAVVLGTVTWRLPGPLRA